jgi:CRP-like cAMP-binding protein
MGMLDTISFLKELSESDKQTLENFCQLKNIPKGEKLFSEGDDANALYILISGELSVYRLEGDNQRLLATLRAEDVIGEMGVFGDDKVRNATVIAQEDTTLVTILDFSIQDLAKKYPIVSEKIQKMISERTIK